MTVDEFIGKKVVLVDFWTYIEKRLDASFGMRRIEIFCARCGSCLEYVFDGGPSPAGKRYYINGVALKFKSENGKQELKN